MWNVVLDWENTRWWDRDHSSDEYASLISTAHANSYIWVWCAISSLFWWVLIQLYHWWGILAIKVEGYNKMWLI